MLGVGHAVGDGSRHRLDVERVDDVGVALGDLVERRGVGGDDRYAGSHGLDHRQPESLVEGRVEEERRSLVDRRQRLVGDVTEQADPIADAELLRALLDLEAGRPTISDADELTVERTDLERPRIGLDDVVEVLVGLWIADEEQVRSLDLETAQSCARSAPPRASRESCPRPPGRRRGSASHRHRSSRIRSSRVLRETAITRSPRLRLRRIMRWA